MYKRISFIGSLFMASGIVLGAFGAHYLKSRLGVEALSSFETGIRYQLYHGLALLALGLAAPHAFTLKWIARFMVWGTLLFSGSIYLLSLKDVLGLQWLRYLGPITPIGGLLLILAWIGLTGLLWKNKQ